jgi:hypothetical protein
LLKYLRHMLHGGRNASPADRDKTCGSSDLVDVPRSSDMVLSDDTVHRQRVTDIAEYKSSLKQVQLLLNLVCVILTVTLSAETLPFLIL